MWGLILQSGWWNLAVIKSSTGFSRLGWVATLFLLMQNVVSLGAFQWPLADPDVVKGFGSVSQDGIYSGLGLVSEKRAVFSPGEGYLVFYQDEGGRRRRLPTGGGSFLIIEHDRGIRSQMEGLDTVVPKSGKIHEDDIVGTLDEGLLFLQIQDYEYQRLVNPLLSLPKLKDEEVPVVRTLFLEREGKQVFLRDGSSLGPGIYNLFVDAVDSGMGEKTVPYSFSLYLNGEEKHRLLFEHITLREGEGFLGREGTLSARDIYSHPGYYHCGEVRLSPGAFTLELAVRDFAGNEESRSFLLRVR